ncbi:amidase signature enzyme [Apiospora phragmitis]|uniref:Amidase signature enzyme n=1 Tax=Apiospora phragmitis TaxID=2905665 RepID=A0ABR1TAH7_9PEZI
MVYIGGVPYLLQHDAPVMNLGPLSIQNGRQHVPATSFGGLVQRETPTAVMRAFEEDAVWTEDFLLLVFYAQNDSDRFEAFMAEIVPSESRASTRTLMVGSDIHGQPVPLAPSPYIFDCATGNLHRPFRLYVDSSNAFVRGCLPIGAVTGKGSSSNSSYQWLEISDLIPVPSKLHCLDEDCTTKPKPLSGLRFGVKDSIDVAGLHTGNGSKCYRELYPPRTETAACVARLLDAGAVLVGKLRCGQWCDGQDPIDRIEEPTPINPRGDGFQKPSGSSSGSAAACASYPWLDFTVGTDTGGSIRHPAAVNGVYGVRPSSGRVQQSDDGGMLVCSPLLDTPGVLARNDKNESLLPQSQVRRRRRRRRFKFVYAVEEADNTTDTTTPKFFSADSTGPEASTPAGQIMESFVSQLETHLDCKRQELNLYDLWASISSASSEEDLETATSTIYQNLVYGNLARTAIDPFVRDYRAEKGPNAYPFIEATTRKRLEYGRGVSDTEMGDSARRLKRCGDWVNNTVLPGPPFSSNTEDVRPADEEEEKKFRSWYIPKSGASPLTVTSPPRAPVSDPTVNLPCSGRASRPIRSPTRPGVPISRSLSARFLSRHGLREAQEKKKGVTAAARRDYR